MKHQTMTIDELARRISEEILPDEAGDRYLLLEREWTFDESRGLGQRTAEELVTLHDRLCRYIPNDFEFSIEFEDGEVHFPTLEYLNGHETLCGMGFPVPLDRHLINSLRQFNWDDLRAKICPVTEHHDDLTDRAAKFPVTLESTAVIQSRHSNEIQRFYKEMAIKPPAHAVLWADEEADELEYKVMSLDNRFDLICEMGDMLACNMAIIAIWSNGAFLAPDAVDELRQEVLEGLKPISRAKAEGRFWSAVQSAQQP
jgi:hypothetical protein